MRKSFILVTSLLPLLTACGLAETTAVGAAGAGSSAEQARQAQQQVEDVKNKLAEAEKAAAEARVAAEDVR